MSLFLVNVRIDGYNYWGAFSPKSICSTIGWKANSPSDVRSRSVAAADTSHDYFLILSTWSTDSSSIHFICHHSEYFLSRPYS